MPRAHLPLSALTHVPMEQSDFRALGPAIAASAADLRLPDVALKAVDDLIPLGPAFA